jgi:uncharacterized protein (DUF362 family)
MPARPEAAITTHPKLVEAAITLIKSIGADILIGDSSGGRGKTQDALSVSGISEVAKRHGVKTVNFDTHKIRKVAVPEGRVLKEIFVTSSLFEVDVVISMPKLKTHALTLFTGAIKNMYGTIPGGRKSQIHALTGSNAKKFAEALIDIYSMVPLHLSLMDGIVGMEGIGPNMGKPKKSGVILAGSNAAALDVVASSLIGYSPRDIPMLRIANERGLGPIDVDDIEIKGEDLKDVRIDFKKPQKIYKGLMFLPSFIRNIFVESPRLPYVNEERCTQCNLCETQCPVDAIKMEGYPSFDYEKCINCYCCYEVCESSGIKLKKSLLPRRLLGTKSRR